MSSTPVPSQRLRSPHRSARRERVVEQPRRRAWACLSGRPGALGPSVGVGRCGKRLALNASAGREHAAGSAVTAGRPSFWPTIGAAPRAPRVGRSPRGTARRVDLHGPLSLAWSRQRPSGTEKSHWRQVQDGGAAAPWPESVLRVPGARRASVYTESPRPAASGRPPCPRHGAAAGCRAGGSDRRPTEDGAALLRRSCSTRTTARSGTARGTLSTQLVAALSRAAVGPL